jgi:hypothetical protein
MVKRFRSTVKGKTRKMAQEPENPTGENRGNRVRKRRGEMAGEFLAGE